MAYTPTIWDEVAPRSTTNLNNLETQYDEAVAEGINIRAYSSEPLAVEVLSSDPTAGTAGRIIFNSGLSKLKYDTGTAWRALAGISGEGLYNRSAGEADWTDGVNAGTGAGSGSKSKEADHLYLLAQTTGSGTYDIAYVTNFTVDTSAYDYMAIEVSQYTSGSGTYLGTLYRLSTVSTGAWNQGMQPNMLNPSVLAGFETTSPRIAVGDISTRTSTADYVRVHSYVDAGSAVKAYTHLYRVALFSSAELVSIFDL